MAGAGLLKGERQPGALDSVFKCLFLTNEVSSEQAIAMIDKYYHQNPEKWSIGIGDAIIEALSVKGSPCETKNDTK